MTAAGRPAAVLWDMDGLLVDTEPLWLAAETAVMARWGVAWTPDDQAVCLGGPMGRVVRYMVDRTGGTADPADVRAALDEAVLERFQAGPVALRPGAAALLRALGAAGVPCALVSASARALVDAALPAVRAVVGADPFAATVAGDEAARTKPDPDPYLRAAAALGVDAAGCVVLEDSPVGVAAGLAAGAVVVAVPHMVRIDPAPRLRVVASLAEVGVDDLRAWAG